MSGKAVVIVYSVKCEQLFQGLTYHFPDGIQLGKFLAGEADNLFFGDYNSDPAQVHFDITTQLMDVDAYNNLVKLQEGEDD